MSRLTLAVMLTLVVGTLGLGVVQQQGSVAGRPDVTVAVDENVTWGTVSLPVRIVSEGLIVQPGPSQFENRVTTARGVRIRLATDRFGDALAESVTVLDGTIRAGSLQSGARETFEFGLRIDTDLPPGRYRLPVVVSYNYTSFVEYEAITEPAYTDRSVRELRQLTFVVPDRPNLVVEPIRDQRISQGTTDTFRVRIRNTGTETARDVGVRLRATGAGVTFAERPKQDSVGIFVPSIPPGESRTVGVAVIAPDDTSPRRYLVAAVVRYTIPDTDRRLTVRRRLGINVTRSPAVTTDERLTASS